MKKGLLLLASFAAFATYAQDCSRLFISEYVEGWGNNKALEIYNPTNQTVNLSEYFVQRYSNGSTVASPQGSAEAKTIQLSGTIAPYGTYVAVIDMRDPAGSGQTAPIWDSLEARADGFYCNDYNTNNVFFFNGNDAVLLAKGSATNPSSASTIVCDVFGKIGEDPENTTAGTNGWTSVSPYIGTAAAGGNPNDRVVTEDHSMIRKANILKGIWTPIVSSFNPLAEWDSIPAVVPQTDEFGNIIYQNDGITPRWWGNWFSLGWHVCDCDPSSGVETMSINDVALYPNPTNGVVYVKGAAGVAVIEVVNSLGQTVTTVENNANPVVKIDLGQKTGLYIVKLTDNKGNSSTKRLIVK